MARGVRRQRARLWAWVDGVVFGEPATETSESSDERPVEEGRRD